MAQCRGVVAERLVETLPQRREAVVEDRVRAAAAQSAERAVQAAVGVVAGQRLRCAFSQLADLAAFNLRGGPYTRPHSHSRRGLVDRPTAVFLPTRPPAVVS